MESESDGNLDLGDTEMNKLVKIDISQANWWVYVPPQRSMAAMNEKAEFLEARGIKGNPQINPGKMRWSVSLGRFSSENGARDFIGRVKSLGFDSVVLNKNSKALSRIHLSLPINDSNKLKIQTLNKNYPSYEWEEKECAKS
tara:strand:- start:73 stop:498 length:426 start_codon:yes stop_codon:yes gene_type:complete